jgi:hypothetical protein
MARAIDEATMRLTGTYGDLPVVVRWHDVQRARRQVVKRKAGPLYRFARNGTPTKDVARLTGLSRETVRRRLRASTDEIMAELDDPRIDHEPMQWDPPPPLCTRCYTAGHVHADDWPRTVSRAVRLGKTVRERWVYAGRLWDASRDRAVQRWHTRHGDHLTDPPLRRPRKLGAAYDAVIVAGHDATIERLAFKRNPEADLPTGDPHIGQWKRATQAAALGEPPPQMRELPRVALPVAEVEPEVQTRYCEEHLPAELRVRIIRQPKWPV